jgi:tetratricopeptide (TPR) repeat protein
MEETMINVEQRTASANRLLEQLQGLQDKFMELGFMPYVESLDQAINDVQAAINSDSFSEERVAEIYNRINPKLQQLEHARQAVSHFIEALNDNHLQHDERFELELLLKQYFIAQLQAIEQTGLMKTELVSSFQNKAALIGIGSDSSFVNKQALDIADTLKQQPVRQVERAVTFKLDISPEQKQALFQQLDTQISKLNEAVCIIARKANALNQDGYTKKAESLWHVEDALSQKIKDYEASQKQAIETHGRMSVLGALSFKKDCQDIINDNKGKFTQHADVLPAFANFLLTVASAVCAFIPLAINKAHTGSCFSFFNTATSKDLARAEKFIESAFQAPSL